MSMRSNAMNCAELIQNFKHRMQEAVENGDITDPVMIDKLSGCEINEILLAASKQNVKRLPQMYIEFMSQMGLNHLPIFPRDTLYTCEFSLLGTNKKHALELLKEDKSALQLSSDIFVFAVASDERFDFFHTKNDDENPPVLSYRNGYAEFVKISETFLGYLHMRLKQTIQEQTNLRKIREQMDKDRRNKR